MHAYMHVWVYEYLTHVCVHTCTCARMRICTFGNTPPPPQSNEFGPLGLPPPPHIEKLPTPMNNCLSRT